MFGVSSVRACCGNLYRLTLLLLFLLNSLFLDNLILVLLLRVLPELLLSLSNLLLFLLRLFRRHNWFNIFL